MKNILALAICFVFVCLANADYGRTRTIMKKPMVQPKPLIHPKPLMHHTSQVIHPKKPVFQHKPLHKPKPVIHPKKPLIQPKPLINHKPAVHPKPIADPWMMNNPMAGGVGGVMPPEIARIIGSTITGEVIRGGMGGWPQHGGAGLTPDGLRNGWGADPNAPLIPAVSNWQDPWNNAAYPIDFQGEDDLIFDPVANQWVRQHQQAKEAQHIRVKTGGGLGPVVNPIGHQVEKQIVGEQMHNVGKVQSGMLPAGKPSYLHRNGPMNVGMIGQVDPAIISHNIGKATLGADAMMGHNIAKSSGPVSGVGFMNPGGHAAGKIGHNMAKSVGAGMGGGPMGGGFVPLSSLNGGMVNPIEHNMVKSSGVGGSPFGGRPEHPVHTVNKVSNSGIVAAGHDPLASAIGHGIAKEVIGEAAHAVEMGSQGGVSAGNPLAIAATHGLANEAAHVAGKVLNVAAQVNPINPNGPIGVGKNIFGGGMPKKPTFQGGYGRTRG